jgi:hypothetical protein
MFGSPVFGGGLADSVLVQQHEDALAGGELG